MSSLFLMDKYSVTEPDTQILVPIPLMLVFEPL